jgi:CheY-like chemotaxis protein
VLQRASGRAVPAVIVSGDSSPQLLMRMQHSGFPALSKPVAPAALRAWLEAVVQAAVRERSSPPQPRAAEALS